MVDYTKKEKEYIDIRKKNTKFDDDFLPNGEMILGNSLDKTYIQVFSQWARMINREQYNLENPPRPLVPPGYIYSHDK